VEFAEWYRVDAQQRFESAEKDLVSSEVIILDYSTFSCYIAFGSNS